MLDGERSALQLSGGELRGRAEPTESRSTVTTVTGGAERGTGKASSLSFKSPEGVEKLECSSGGGGYYSER
jgi:hypothetical protein